MAARSKKSEIERIADIAEQSASLLKKDAKILNLERQNQTLKISNKQLHQDCERLTDLLDLKSDLADKSSIRNWKPLRRKAIKTDMAAIALLSDWHVEERVDLRKTNGANEYNPDIAERRARRIFHLICEYIRRHVPDADVLYLALLGDFITGYIHEDLRRSNYYSPPQAVLFAKRLLVSGIEFIKSQKVVKKIICPTAVGNHGRTDEKRLVQMSEENSYEWLMYHIIAEHFDGDKEVDFLISDAYINPVQIFGHKLRFHHGEAIRYQGGVGGHTIPTNKKIAGWNKTPTIVAELDCFGHHHKYFDGGDFVTNGSMIGTGAYSQVGAFPHEEPVQAFIALSRSRGKYLTAKMFCED